MLNHVLQCLHLLSLSHWQYCSKNIVNIFFVAPFPANSHSCYILRHETWITWCMSIHVLTSIYFVMNNHFLAFKLFFLSLSIALHVRTKRLFDSLIPTYNRNYSNMQTYVFERKLFTGFPLSISTYFCAFFYV